jgi:excisionase family DNA binding protein
MHIYRLIADGELRAVDISQRGSKRSKTRVRSDDLEAYIEVRTRTVGTPTSAA